MGARGFVMGSSTEVMTVLYGGGSRANPGEFVSGCVLRTAPGPAAARNGAARRVLRHD
jgi:hypothetical protein